MTFFTNKNKEHGSHNIHPFQSQFLNAFLETWNHIWKNLRWFTPSYMVCQCNNSIQIFETFSITQMKSGFTYKFHLDVVHLTILCVPMNTKSISYQLTKKCKSLLSHSLIKSTISPSIRTCIIPLHWQIHISQIILTKLKHLLRKHPSQTKILPPNRHRIVCFSNISWCQKPNTLHHQILADKIFLILLEITKRLTH